MVKIYSYNTTRKLPGDGMPMGVLEEHTLILVGGFKAYVGPRARLQAELAIVLFTQV
jgi:hypothetical protein